MNTLSRSIHVKKIKNIEINCIKMSEFDWVGYIKKFILLILNTSQ